MRTSSLNAPQASDIFAPKAPRREAAGPSHRVHFPMRTARSSAILLDKLISGTCDMYKQATGLQSMSTRMMLYLSQCVQSVYMPSYSVTPYAILIHNKEYIVSFQQAKYYHNDAF